MELRKYQEEVLECVTGYLDKLIEHKKQQDEFNKFQASQGNPLRYDDLAYKAWSDVSTVTHIPRKDGLGQSIPHICLKVPTGGGKTLLATHAVKKINQHYFKRNTGLVLWVTPSDAIYQQTLRAFTDPDHPYRQVLDRAAPRRRAKILERQNTFSPLDVYDDFSVMPLMTQAGARNLESKEALRMFKNNGGYMDFFPSSNDYQKHEELLDQFPNLDHRGTDRTKIIKYSLGNVLKILRPIIVLDEGHTAVSPIRQETFSQFNPRFILELSATPNENSSNILVNVSGQTLKDEEMIKLPIRLKNTAGGEWKTTLSESRERLNELQKKADKHRSNGGGYIRPILLVRVENTGKKQRGKGTVHSEDVREYLTTELGFGSEQVRVKSSEIDEIEKENLLSPTCPVRVVITKDALKEGWDCPFAYILTLLDNTQSTPALTQMIGRVLRQPYARLTHIDDLDSAHIFCFNQNVVKIVGQIKNSLDNHGLGDVVDKNVLSDQDEITPEQISRRKQFKDLDVLMPQVLHVQGKKSRPLDYERDILSNIKWSKLKFGKQELLLDREQQVTEAEVDIGGYDRTESKRVAMEGEVSNEFFVRNLSDIVPNPWQAMRIVQDSRPSIDERGTSQDIYNDRMNIVKQMRADIGEQREKEAETIFQEKIENQEILFQLDATESAWKIPKTMTIKHIGTRKYLTRETNEQLSLSLFEKYEERDFNQYEKKIAGYLDEHEAIKWWHRVAARQEYGLQGWRKHLVYPDFVAFVNKEGGQSLILETKGEHLANNQDTRYKEKLFNILENNYLDVGAIKISGVGDKIMLRIIYDQKTGEDWKHEVNAMLT